MLHREEFTGRYTKLSLRGLGPELHQPPLLLRRRLLAFADDPGKKRRRLRVTSVETLAVVGAQGDAHRRAIPLGNGDRRLAQVAVDEGVVGKGTAGDHLDAVAKAVVGLDDGEHLLHAQVLLDAQRRQSQVASPHPEGDVGAEMAMQLARFAQQAFQVSLPDQGLRGCSWVDWQVHRFPLVAFYSYCNLSQQDYSTAVACRQIWGLAK